MIYDVIKNFNKQFEYEPEIENAGRLKKHKSFVVVGMGGSHLAADLLKIIDPSLDIYVHSGYGLPAMPPEHLKKSLIILSSYSGNTEETIDAFEEAGRQGLALAVITVGGKLSELAEKERVPYVKLPNGGIQPRSALGFTSKALLKIMGEEKILKGMDELPLLLKPEEMETEGKELAEKLRGSVPVIYSSLKNQAIAYNWKIKFNESGKIPAFFDVFPELNHNEMTGFDVKESTKELSRKFHFIFLKDDADHPRILKRMEITAKLYRDRNLPVEIAEIRGKDQFQKIFSSLILADWTAYYTGDYYGVDTEQVPMVEEFKKMIM